MVNNMVDAYGDYDVAEGADFKGPLLAHGAQAMQRLAKATGWTLAKVVRRAVRAFAFHLAAHPEVCITPPNSSQDMPVFAGRYDTGIESESLDGVEAIAQRFHVRRNVVVAEALDWYAHILEDRPAGRCSAPVGAGDHHDR